MRSQPREILIHMHAVLKIERCRDRKGDQVLLRLFHEDPKFELFQGNKLQCSENFSVLYLSMEEKGSSVASSFEGYSEEDIACIPDVKSSTSGIPDVIGRYYYQYVNPNGHQYLYQHTNHICVVGLAKDHPILKEGKTVKGISFKSGKFDYSQIEVSGRTKKVIPLHCLLSLLSADYTFSISEGRVLDGAYNTNVYYHLRRWYRVSILRRYPCSSYRSERQISYGTYAINNEGNIQFHSNKFYNNIIIYCFFPLSQPATEGYIALLKPKYNENETTCAGLTKVQDPRVVPRENL